VNSDQAIDNSTESYIYMYVGNILINGAITPTSEIITERRPHNLRHAGGHSMQDCGELLLHSVQQSRVHRAGRPKSEPDRARLYQSINSNIITLLCLQGSNGSNDAPRTDNRNTPVLLTAISGSLPGMVHDYVWLTRCCNNATEIADTFNSTHLAGMLVCKCFAILLWPEAAAAAPAPAPPGGQGGQGGHRGEAAGGATVPSLFPAYTTIHVSHKSIRDMCYSELVFVVTSLQQKWEVLITKDIVASSHALVCCMARFGDLVSQHWPAKVLDDTQERENAPNTQDAATSKPADPLLSSPPPDTLHGLAPGLASGGNKNTLWVLSKRATRHFVTTFLCMAREMAISHASHCITVNTMTHSEYGKYTADEVMAYGFKLAPDISDNIRLCFGKIKSIREAGNRALLRGEEQNHDKHDNHAAAATGVPLPVPVMPTPDKTWDFLVKKLGPHKLGPRPRKMNADFATLLSDVIVSLSDTYNQPDNITVTRSCLNIIQTALKFYYIVPSAERFREIVLMQNLCPGQRLNYAFDYMHFDTGAYLSVDALWYESSLCSGALLTELGELGVGVCVPPGRSAVPSHLSTQPAVQTRGPTKHRAGLERRLSRWTHRSILAAHHRSRDLAARFR